MALEQNFLSLFPYQQLKQASAFEPFQQKENLFQAGLKKDL